jgi:RNA polymerase sigma-B factor
MSDSLLQRPMTTPTITLTADPAAAAAARVFIRDNANLDSMRRTEADLLVTELIANVVEHGEGVDEIELSARVDTNVHRISVSHRAERGLEDPELGIGLTLVDRIARRWGSEHDDGVLTVWFELRNPGAITATDTLTDAELFARMEEDPLTFSDALVARHQDLATAIARRYRSKGISQDDLDQVAMMGLLKAIHRFDPELGEIRSYAAATISGEMKKLLRDKGWSVRVPRPLQEQYLSAARANDELTQALGRAPTTAEIAEHLGIGADEVEEAVKAGTAYSSRSIQEPAPRTGVTLMSTLMEIDPNLAGADERAILEGAIDKLPERERQVLDLRFNEDLTQSEIAEIIGVSQMHVSRLLARAIESLREELT